MEHMTGGEQNLKLAATRQPLDSTRLGRLANFLYFSLMQGIGLGSFELVIMKGKGERRTAIATSQGVAPAEVTGPRLDKAWQHEDTIARARARVTLFNARVEPLGGACAAMCTWQRYLTTRQVTPRRRKQSWVGGLSGGGRALQ